MGDEVWKPFPNHPQYEVSNKGRVRRKDTGRVRALVKIKSGYMTVMLTDCYGRKLEYVHRAVANAFIPNVNNYPQINHKDKNRENNCVENLEWCTAMQNIQHATSKRVAQYTKDGKFVNSFVGVREAERYLKVSHGAIDRAAKGEYKSSHGFLWRYLDE